MDTGRVLFFETPTASVPPAPQRVPSQVKPSNRFDAAGRKNIASTTANENVMSSLYESDEVPSPATKKSFTTDTAQARITALADALEITQEEADELSALAKEHGTSGATLEERVAALEERALEHEEALVELAGMMTGSGVE